MVLRFNKVHRFLQRCNCCTDLEGKRTRPSDSVCPVRTHNYIVWKTTNEQGVEKLDRTRPFNQAQNKPRRTLDGHSSPVRTVALWTGTWTWSRGEVVCNVCGLIADDNLIDPGAEWTNRDHGEDRAAQERR